jgi:hypothetical protein
MRSRFCVGSSIRRLYSLKTDFRLHLCLFRARARDLFDCQPLRRPVKERLYTTVPDFDERIISQIATCCQMLIPWMSTVCPLAEEEIAELLQDEKMQKIAIYTIPKYYRLIV